MRDSFRICNILLSFSDPHSPEWKERVNKIPVMAKKKMAESGKLMIGYQSIPEKNIGNCFRMAVTALPKPEKEDMTRVIKEIREIVNECQNTENTTS